MEVKTAKSCVVCRSPEAKSRCSRWEERRTYKDKAVQMLWCLCCRCHSQRYCGRDCQLKHWPRHKEECARTRTRMLEEDRKKEEERRQHNKIQIMSS